ncbi:MAG: PIG-L family deacetylase [Chitinophagaceae bacterium]
MKKIAALIIPLFYSCILPAQAPQSWTSAEMYQALKKLNVLGSVLYVAAHPDDENTRLITYLSNEKLYRTGYLSITRGDGGQNLIGDEQGIELGLIRTQELLAARRIDGGEQFFSRAIDFGYSKTPDETFTKWDKEKILSDVVWIIRKFQPDVIITRFPTTGEGGHGHHTASAILANEAFAAAADPKRFPEQLAVYGLKPWQAKCILWNTFNFGGTNSIRDDQYKLDVGGYNPLLGKSYGEIASASRSQHKSQGFGVPATRGEALEYFKATKGDQPVNDLMDGIDMTWKRLNGGEVIEKTVDSLAATFDFTHPEKSVQGLVALFQQLELMPESYWRNKKFRELYQLIEQCSGLFIDATTTDPYAVQTDSVKINFVFNNRLGADATLKTVSTDGFDTTMNRRLERNKNFSFSKTLFVPANKPVTQPYWLANKTEEGYYNVSDQEKIGMPDAEPAYSVLVRILMYGEPMKFMKTVKYKFTDPVKGELYEPLVVIPAMLITSVPELKIMINKDEKLLGELQVLVKRPNMVATLHTDYFLKNNKPDPNVSFNPASINTTEKNQTLAVSYMVKSDSPGTYRFLAKDNNSNYASTKKIKEIKYDHIPYISYMEDAEATFKKIDVKTYNKRIGYIVGAGDKVPEALEQMGYEVNRLTEKELSRNSLDKFDAIITGVRAYNTNEWMNKHYDKLMKYVNDGGNLIVQYNTSNQIGPVRAKISPYNFDISRTRVTDENASVTFLKPDHPVMNFPNKITRDDFTGWIQERSIYHAAAYDTAKFQPIFSMNDPGEKPDAGSLIIAKYGKGWFTYTGMVFFRELPAGVPGAYRLLANIIALNKKKAF